MSNNVFALKGIHQIPPQAPKSLRSTTEAVILTSDAIAEWKDPRFQRPLRVNAKVTALAEHLKTHGGILPGILTIGMLGKERFLVDGQHRIEAFKISALPEVYAEIRICHFDSFAAMSDEFVLSNSKLVSMKPDDILRGLEASNPGLAMIRKRCEYVGYDMVRRGGSAPIVSMSAMLRCWFGSANDTPSSTGTSAASFTKILTEEEASKCCDFLVIAYGAWKRDPEYHRLWGALNLSLTMWLWRRTVLSQYSPKTPRLSPAQFGKCAMSLSASSDYLDWLLGRNLGERDRSPAYSRIKAIFARRIEEETGKKPQLPSPAWQSSQNSRGPAI